MGALIALECASRQPARVERIALIGVAYPMKVSAAFLDAAQRDDHAAFDMETIWGHAAQVPLGGNPNPGMWMYGDTLARLARLAPGVLHTDLAACNAYAAGMEAAAKVKCPALFVLGARDVMTPPRAAQDLAKAIERYFSSDLYKRLAERRPEIQAYANKRYSWTTVGEATRRIYSRFSRNN